MVLAALFLAMSYILPYFTGQIPELGSALCPMHFPVMLCGFICGGGWGCIVGAVAPILRSLLTGGFPPMFPTAVAMSVELAVYGLSTGIIYSIFKKKPWSTYPSLIISMILGRLAWGFTMLTIVSEGFTFEAFIVGAVTNALPGIILQLILVPVAVILINTSLSKNRAKPDTLGG